MYQNVADSILNLLPKDALVLQLPAIPRAFLFMDLRLKFANYVVDKWHQNNHDLEDIPCVYVILSLNYWEGYKGFDIKYVGSTTKLKSRYKSHKIPKKVQNLGLISLMYYMPMNKGFYDYEIKLIRKLQPQFNKLRYGNI